MKAKSPDKCSRDSERCSRALLDADVNYKVAKTFTDTVKKKALGMNVLTAIKPGQLMVKLVHDELAELMGGEAKELDLTGHPTIIMMAGLNGAGKTTMSGKLAKLLKDKRNKKPLLAACDTFRPAAMEQLRVLAETVEVPIYLERRGKKTQYRWHSTPLLKRKPRHTTFLL